jgi:hypothetical protein
MNDLFYNLNEILKEGPIYLEKFEISINAIKKTDENYYLSIYFNRISCGWVIYDNLTLLFKEELNNFINKHPVNKNIWND